VGAKLGVDQFGRVHDLNVQRMRGAPKQVEEMVRQTTIADGVMLLCASNRSRAARARSSWTITGGLLHGYDVRGIPSTSNKVLRAKPWLISLNRAVSQVRAPWNAACSFEFEAFPNGLPIPGWTHARQPSKNSTPLQYITGECDGDGRLSYSRSRLSDKGVALFRAWYLNGPTIGAFHFRWMGAVAIK